MTAMPTHSYTSSFGSLLPFFRAPARGVCARCEQHSLWDDQGDHFRCRHCSADPLAHADDVHGLPDFGDASHLYAPRAVAIAPPARTAWLAERLEGVAAWLTAQAERLRTPSGPRPAHGAG